MLKKISFKGVIIGAVVDVVGTNIWLFGVVGYLIIKHQLYALPPGEQMGELYRLYGDPAIKVLNTIVGVGFSIIGGYRSSRAAERRAFVVFMRGPFPIHDRIALDWLGDRRTRGKSTPWSSWREFKTTADAKLIWVTVLPAKRRDIPR